MGVLGLHEGDAHVIRNAGGVVTDDELRSLAISQRLLGTEEIILIHHTDCGMLTFTDDDFKRGVEEETGVKPDWAAEAFTDLDEDVRQSIARIKASPFIPHKESCAASSTTSRTGRCARSPRATSRGRAIIGGVDQAAELVAFYDDSYSREGAEAQLGARWRALSAVGKADHVVALCARVGVAPSTIVEVGCGDGALLSELHARGFGSQLSGFEITDAAVEIARARPHLHAVDRYDGSHLPVPDGAYDLGILSHVLEHVPDPAALLREVGRACRAVVVEVPLEANVSARRSVKRAGAEEVGHLHAFDRAAVGRFVADAGLRVAADLDDPLPLSVHRFFAVGAAARARATVKWGVRAGACAAAPPVARRLFTVHYACMCLAR